MSQLPTLVSRDLGVVMTLAPRSRGRVTGKGYLLAVRETKNVGGYPDAARPGVRPALLSRSEFSQSSRAVWGNCQLLVTTMALRGQPVCGRGRTHR